MAKNKRKPQTPKARNESYMRGMQALRMSNASGPHQSNSDYRRKAKHPGKGWE